PGGAGKTRLALQVAADAIDRFADGVFFVALAPVRDAALVIPTVARTLGLREQPWESPADTLADYLRDRAMLLVLDNLEHVSGAAPDIAALAGCDVTGPTARNRSSAVADRGRAPVRRAVAGAARAASERRCCGCRR